VGVEGVGRGGRVMRLEAVGGRDKVVGAEGVEGGVSGWGQCACGRESMLHVSWQWAREISRGGTKNRKEDPWSI